MTAQRHEEQLAVVLPAHNEAERIAACLSSLQPFVEAGDPVVVVDDGSTDDTASIATSAGATVIRADGGGGRARAVRQGYEYVAPLVTVVLIVHADMQFPSTARQRLLESLAMHPDAPGAFFGHRIDDPRRRFRLVERGNQFRARRGTPYGDQAMAVRTGAVTATGGFPDVDALEDLMLARQLRGRGRWVDLERPVTIDARHWGRGIVRTTVRNWRIAFASRLRSIRETCQALPGTPAAAAPRRNRF